MVSPILCVVSPLNGGVRWVACCPRVRIGFPSSHCSRPFLRCFSCSPFLPSTVCVLCYSIVGLGVCLCGRVMSLWNSGDGLCWVEGRVASTVYCQLFMCCGVCFSVVCVLSCCAVLWVVEWRGGGVRVCGLVVCLLLFSVSFFFSLVSFVGGVRGSARAALRARTLSPNTIVFPCCLVCSSLFRSPPFCVLEWRWAVHHVLVCCVGMTAMGSLSRSSSFFW